MALSLGQDPDRINMRDGMMMARAAVKAGRAPSIGHFFDVPERAEKRSGRFMLHHNGKQVQTSGAETAEDFELMVKSGWAVRGEAAA